MIIFEMISKLNKRICLNKERSIHILSRVEMKNQENKIKETLTSPNEIRESLKDKSIWIYYKKYSKTPVTQKYMLVVVKVLNNEGEVITAFFTDRIKKGEIIWRKN